MSPFPNVPQNFISVRVGFSPGTPFSQTKAVGDHILEQAEALNKNAELLEKNGNKPFIREINRTLNETRVSVFVGLTENEQRQISADTVAEVLREMVGPVPEAQSFSLNASMSGGGPEITLNLNLLENRRDIQQAAVDSVSQALAAFPGVLNVRSNLASERTEVEIELKPYAETMGITLGEVAKQVRQGFYGEEIQRIPRAKEDVRVMLRYLADERQTLGNRKTKF